MFNGQLPQSRAATCRQAYPDLAPVFRPGCPLDGAGLFQAVHEFDGAVVLNEHSRGKLANGWFDAFRQAVHAKQQLVLLRLDTVPPCNRFAEMQKTPDLTPELGEVAILFYG